MDPIRRNILATGAAATAMAAAPGVFAQQAGQGGAAMGWAGGPGRPKGSPNKIKGGP